MADMIHTDDQPMASTFFGEGKWLTEFITPNNLEVQELYCHLTENLKELDDKVQACWAWVASQVKYRDFVKGKIWVGGKVSIQDDLWMDPSMVIRTKVGNCVNKSFLLTSLLRNEMYDTQVYCVLGNLYNGKPGGHSWCLATINGQDYILESTRPDIPPMIAVSKLDRYEAVHLFNDKEVYTIEGRSVLTPFAARYSTWLKSYLDWAHIRGEK